MKDYRKDELKTYVIGNILIILMFSGLFEIFFTLSEELSEEIIDIVSKLLCFHLYYTYMFLF